MKHIPAKMWTSPDKFVTEDGKVFEVTYDENADDPRDGDDSVKIITVSSWDHTPEWNDDSEIERAAHAIWNATWDVDIVCRAINTVPDWHAESHGIVGACQSDWATVLALTEEPDMVPYIPSYVKTFEMWRYGRVFVVTHGDDCLGGIYADSMEEAVRCFIEESEGAA